MPIEKPVPIDESLEGNLDTNLEKKILAKFYRSLAKHQPCHAAALYLALLTEKTGAIDSELLPKYISTTEQYLKKLIGELRRRELEKVIEQLRLIIISGEATEKTRTLIQMAQRRLTSLLVGTVNPRPMQGGSPGSRR